MSLLETLSGVHALGIVHRDLKPGNVLVQSDGVPWVLDFGLSAPAFYAPADPLDRIAGTPAYLAPEQVEAGPIDQRADLYALGAMLFQALTGRLPHEGPDVRALLAAKFLPPPPIRNLVPSLSPRVASVIDALLIANPEKRPGSASEVARALAERPSEAPASIWPDRLTRSEMPLSVAETSDLFWPSHGFASVAEDAGALLHALTGGDRLRLRQELERWLSDRVVRDAIEQTSNRIANAAPSPSAQPTTPAFKPQTSAQWAKVAPLVLPGRNQRSQAILRKSLDGIRWVLHHNTPWQKVPKEYGTGTTCWRWYKRWQEEGTWNTLLPLIETFPR